ncbi:hypothetical protein [Homoserinimonas hongtaonis]|nr:hypothetical protein [Salinibacterium hongtaonis]
MSETPSLPPAPAGERLPWRIRRASTPGWMLALGIYALSRALSTTLLAAMYSLAVANDWEFASRRPEGGFFAFLGSWDASFYRQIAENGYPSTLPRDDTGMVAPNEWAFLPLFPWLANGVRAITGLEFYPAAVLVATLCGAGAAVVLFLLTRAKVSQQAALWATAFFCCGPLGFLLQVAYAESLFLLLTFGSLLALVRRHYWLLTVLAMAAAFSRPGALAIALALGIHLVLRWVGDEPFPWRDRISIVLGGILISAAGLSWPFIASAATGSENAYLETELAWWVPLVGRQEFVPLAPWFLLAARWAGVAGIVAVVAVVALSVVFLTRKSTLALGSEIVSYAASYGLYLFAVFLPQQSTLRLLMPLAPLLASDLFTSTPRRRWAVLSIGAALQPVAIVLLWFLSFP